MNDTFNLIMDIANEIKDKPIGTCRVLTWTQERSDDIAACGTELHAALIRRGIALREYRETSCFKVFVPFLTPPGIF